MNNCWHIFYLSNLAHLQVLLLVTSFCYPGFGYQALIGDMLFSGWDKLFSQLNGYFHCKLDAPGQGWTSYWTILCHPLVTHLQWFVFKITWNKLRSKWNRRGILGFELQGEKKWSLKHIRFLSSVSFSSPFPRSKMNPVKFFVLLQHKYRDSSRKLKGTNHLINFKHKIKY